ncbi:MAG: hypothetical protein U9O55_03020 [Patescibacteria group bacterium]|nr:hypothetical protein [Patescibacteria group bacterium]
MEHNECFEGETGYYENWTWACAQHPDYYWYQDDQINCDVLGQICQNGSCVCADECSVGEIGCSMGGDG